MKKILVITYYWPPSGGAGVQRWLKFVKYLPEFGWEPVVYTPSNPENPVDDNQLLKDIPDGIEIIKTPIWEPYDLYKKFVGRKKDDKINSAFLNENRKTGITEKLSVWIRGNFFIPDARKFWIRPSIRFLSEYLKKNKIDVIASTGPPHSMHLVALGLKKQFNIPWLTDFRDPWTNIDYYHELKLTPLADKKHHRLEKDVLSQADAVVSVGKIMSEELEKMVSNGNKEKFHVITNGYDEGDLFCGDIVPDQKFSLAHIGTLVKSRNPETLWQVLSELISRDEKFKNDLEIKLVGKVDLAVLASLEQYGLDSHIKKIDYLPHAEVIRLQQQSQVLLLLLNQTPNAKGILTGKMFEYLSSRRPILCIGPVDGDAAEIIRLTKSGEIVDFHDEEKLKSVVLKLYNDFISGKLTISSVAVNNYSRKNLTSKLAEVLNDISSNSNKYS